MRLLAEIATRARIDGTNKERLCREPRSHPRAGDADVSHLESLPKRFEGSRPEVDQLVEEEHAMMGKSDLTRSHRIAPAKEGDSADCVMRRAEGADMAEPAF
jgi:hypothetical protein